MNDTLVELLIGTRSHWRRQKTIRQLSALSNHALKVIGLDRSEIRSIVEDLAPKIATDRVRGLRAARPGTPLSSRPNTPHPTQRGAV